MTSSDAADIDFLDLSRGAFKTLRDKGWVADLSSSQKLMDTIAAMDAHLVKPLAADGSSYDDMTMDDLKNELRYSHAELEMVEQERLAFLPEEVAYYYEHVEPYLVTITDALFQGKNNQASAIMQQFIDGSMDAEHFIREFDRIVDMIQLEQGV